MENKPERQVFDALRHVSNLRALRRDEPKFRQVLCDALSAVSTSGREKVPVEYVRFLDSVCVRLIETPSDVVSLCALLPDEDLKLELLRFLVRHSLVDLDLLIAFASPAILETLPRDSSWLEPIVLTYGSSKLGEGRKLSIAEIAPLGIDTERSTVRSLLSSALDAGLLLEGEEQRLLKLFPSDKYFQGRIKRP